MTWRSIVIGSAAVLAGCASLTTHVDRVEVPVPVVQGCVDARDLPPMPPSAMQPGANIERLAAGASADLRALQLHAQKLDALLRACSTEQEKR